MNIHLKFFKHCWQYPILVTLQENARISRPEVFYKEGVFENFANQRCFRVNFAKFSRTSFFKEHLFSQNNFSGCSWKSKSRSSKPEAFCKKGVLRNFSKFTGNSLCQSLFFTALGIYSFSVLDTGLFLWILWTSF